MNPDLLEHEKQHLASLLEAVQRCVYFLDAADSTVTWPLAAQVLEQHKKDKGLFGALAAINERFAKLQDTLGAAMRHAMGLLSEPSETFLQVLAFYEKVGVIASLADWQTCRTARNLAAHSYETDYESIAEHFNALHEMQPVLYASAREFVSYCRVTIGITPASEDFADDFIAIVGSVSR